MKHKSFLYCFLIIFIISFNACKKEKESAKKLYLSKVFEDGLLADEFIYSADKKPLRRNLYSTNTGQSVYSSFRLYEYNSAGLVETMTAFTKNNLFNSKYKLTYDVSKRPTRMDDLAADNSVQFYYIFDYDNQGNFSKYSLFNGGTNKKTIEATFSYNTSGTVSKIIRRNFLNNPSTLYDSSTLSFGNRKLPDHWNYYETLSFVALPNGDRLFWDMACDSTFRYYVDAPPITSTATFSNKQYNSAGYLTKQNVTYKGNNGLGTITTNNYERTYEYMQ